MFLLFLTLDGTKHGAQFSHIRASLAGTLKELGVREVVPPSFRAPEGVCVAHCYVTAGGDVLASDEDLK